MARFTSKPENLASVETLCRYFDSKPDGAKLTWVEIEAGTGIKMSGVWGRDLARRALKKLKRPYGAMIGIGVELSAPVNALDLAGDSVRRVRSAIKNGKKRTGQLRERHEEAMPAEARQSLVLLDAQLGGLQLGLKQVRKAIHKELSSGPSPADASHRLGLGKR